MRTKLTVLAFFLVQIVFGQVKPAIYRMTDTTDRIFGQSSYKLAIEENHTFTYYFRTSTSCFGWYDLKGKWKTSGDSLTLVDEVMSFHSVVTFGRYTPTSNGYISILVRTKQRKPVSGMKILYMFKGSRDSLSGFTNSKGIFVIDTKDRVPTVSEQMEGGGRSIDDVQIWAVYKSKDGSDWTTNTFSDLSGEIECVIDKDAKDELATRTIIYKIEENRLIRLSESYDKDDVRPARRLFGDFLTRSKE